MFRKLIAVTAKATYSMICVKLQPQRLNCLGIWWYMAVLTTRKQTYPFKTMAVNETFKIKKEKYNSMLTSHRQHNKDHPDKALQIKAAPCSLTHILITRTS